MKRFALGLFAFLGVCAVPAFAGNFHARCAVNSFRSFNHFHGHKVAIVNSPFFVPSYPVSYAYPAPTQVTVVQKSYQPPVSVPVATTSVAAPVTPVNAVYSQTYQAPLTVTSTTYQLPPQIIFAQPSYSPRFGHCR